MPQEKDSAFRRFLENPDCFCDLFNGALFQGKQVLEPYMLEPAAEENRLQVPDKQGKKRTVRRYRDAVRKASGKLQYAVYGVLSGILPDDSLAPVLSLCVYSREQRAKYPCLHGYLATAARVKYPAAEQRYKLDTLLLAAGSLITDLNNGRDRRNFGT